MKIWISKYALSGEITCHECESPNDGGYVFPKGKFMSFTAFKVGMDAHTSAEAAIYAAEESRLKKIASLKKQIAKLEKMTFAAPMEPEA